MEPKDHVDQLDEDAYEAPELTSYGTIEEWTRGVRQIEISIVI